MLSEYASHMRAHVELLPTKCKGANAKDVVSSFKRIGICTLICRGVGGEENTSCNKMTRRQDEHKLETVGFHDDLVHCHQ